MTTVAQTDHGAGGSWHGYEVISRGANRVCVVDPENPRRCLKFDLPQEARTEAGPRERLRRWLGHRFEWLSNNAVELRAWQKMSRRHGVPFADRFAACRGLVHTPHGTGLRCDRILREDGTPAPTLHALLPRLRDREAMALCEAVTDFENWLLHNAVPLRDLNPANFVVVEAGAGMRLICIDAKSILQDKALLPLSRWLPALTRRKQARRAERLRQRILAAADCLPLAVHRAAH